jgi:hypothetical protein
VSYIAWLNLGIIMGLLRDGKGNGLLQLECQCHLDFQGLRLYLIMYLSSHQLGKLVTGSLIPEYAILASNTLMLSLAMALAHGHRRIIGEIKLLLNSKIRTTIHTKRFLVRLMRAIIITSWWKIH